MLDKGPESGPQLMKASEYRRLLSGPDKTYPFRNQNQPTSNGQTPDKD